jgi:hypothetical protein
MTEVVRSVGEKLLTGKPVTLSLCPLQIRLGLHWDSTRFSSARYGKPSKPWNGPLCFVGRYQRFVGICCLHSQDSRVVSQMIVMLIFAKRI